MEKSADAFRTISEVADDLTLPQHVLRFWETRFPQIRPLKRAGGRRYYRPADIVLLKTIRQLLYDDGYTIKGVQRLLKEQGPKAFIAQAPDGAAEPPDETPELTEETLPMLPDPASDDDPPEIPHPDTLTASAVYRDALIEAVATIDECLRIHSDVRRKS